MRAVAAAMGRPRLVAFAVLSSMAATVSATLAWRFDDPFIIARVAEYTVAEIALPVEPTTDSAYPLTGQPPPAPTCKRRTCTSEKGILFLSKHRDNLGDVAANSPEECCMACDRHPQCTRYSYYDGSCTLKKASSQWTPGTALTSGLVVGGCECRLSTSCPKSAQSCGAGNWLDLESCQCKACKACGPNKYVSRECTLTHNTKCKRCTQCPPGQMELKPCTATTDTLCHGIELKDDQDLYDVLGVPRDASQSEIRARYKMLSTKLHPDKNPDPGAAKLFAEISAAYAILGDPDKRSTYDDFGDANMEGFGSYWEYQQSQTKASRDFYTGESLITRLTSKNWEQRMTHGFWFVKFYAPWCTHCITSSAAFKEVARELDGEIEFGAVNCVAEQDLQHKFQVPAFPSFYLIAPELGFQLQYNWRGPDALIREMPEWARGLAREWKLLGDRSRIVRLTYEKFEAEVLNSTAVWVVMFTTGSGCVACQEAQSNFYRFGSDVTGVARVGIADCSNPELRHRICNAHGIPDRDYPHFWVYPAGEDKADGQVLFNRHDVPVHAALPVIARTLRAGLTHYLVEDGELLVKPDDETDYEDNRKKEEDKKPPPPPSYDQPPPRPNFHGIEGYGRPSHKALGQG